MSNKSSKKRTVPQSLPIFDRELSSKRKQPFIMHTSQNICIIFVKNYENKFSKSS